MSDPANPNPTPTPTPQPTPTPDPAPAPEPTPAPEPDKKEGETVLGKPEVAPFDPEAIKFPEGLSKDDATFGDFTNIAKEHGLTGPAAQALLDLHAKQIKAASESLQVGYDKQQEDWLKEIKADKEIGDVDVVRQTFAKVAQDPELTDPAFREALNFTGAGNHPAVVRTLFRWAKALSEGGPVRGSPGARDAQGNAAVTAPQSLGQAFYGPNGPHQGGPKLT